MKSIIIAFFLLGSVLITNRILSAQQCATIIYLDDNDPPSSIPGYAFEHEWELQNIGSCDAINYYLTPFEAEYFNENSGNWESYSGMNFQFYRSDNGNPIQSDRFSLASGQQVSLAIRFNVSPVDLDRSYRVYFDIYDGANNPLPPLPGGRLFVQFNFQGPNLQILGVSTSPNSVCPDHLIEITATLRNSSDAPIPTNLIEYWFSDNSTLSDADYLIGTDILDILLPGEQIQLTENAAIPSDADNGNGYVFVKADAENIVNETFEGDNIDNDPITIQSSGCVAVEDLFITNLVVEPLSLYDDQPIDVSATINYTGVS
ncbi:MAG: hypothetical protein AAFY91_17000, partial [Bacteroidota bacterium]